MHRPRLRTAALAGLAAVSSMPVLVAAPHGQAATPLACASPCVIDASFFAYVAPATEIASGGSVQFRAVDFSHPTTDGAPGSTGNPCFAVTTTPGQLSEAVTFDVVGGGLTATVGGATTPCESAVPLAAGALALPYRCQLHPNMNGVLVVS